MKKGKTSKLSGFRNSKITFGTVDSKNFKSLYLNLQTWAEPKEDVENWTRVVLNMNRSIKHSIFNNIYLIVDFDFKDLKLKRKLKEIVKGLYNDVLHKNDNFKFYLTKNGNVKPIKVKTEKV